MTLIYLISAVVAALLLLREIITNKPSMPAVVACMFIICLNIAAFAAAVGERA